MAIGVVGSLGHLFPFCGERSPLGEGAALGQLRPIEAAGCDEPLRAVARSLFLFPKAAVPATLGRVWICE
jgi:hypothetical protein